MPKFKRRYHCRIKLAKTAKASYQLGIFCTNCLKKWRKLKNFILIVQITEWKIYLCPSGRNKEFCKA